MHVKKGDMVVVVAGKDRFFRDPEGKLRGGKGRVIAVDRQSNRVRVERLNLITKNQKPNPLTGTEGAQIQRENWIHASNVALYSEKIDGPVRTSKRYVGKDGQLFNSRTEAEASFGAEPPDRIKKVRYANKTEEVFDEV